MDNNKLIPMIGIFITVFFLFQAWTGEQAEKEAAFAAQQSVSTNTATVAGVSNDATQNAVPTLQAENANGVVMQANNAATSTAGQITIKTDLYNLVVSLQGGTIMQAGLRDYPTSLDTPDVSLDLLKTANPDTFQLQTGLLTSDNQRVANHQSTFSAAQQAYEMTGDTLEVPLVWEEDGISVVKTLVFTKGKYDFHIRQAVTNGSTTPWQGTDYQQFTRVPPVQNNGFGSVRSYVGGAYSTAEKNYQKITFKQMTKSPLNIVNEGGWIAMLQHYFIGAIIPEPNQSHNFYTNTPSPNNYIFGMSSRELASIAPGESKTFDSHIYVGPKIQKDLNALAPNLKRAVDYGFLWFIAEPLFQGLKFFHGLIGNWGWAIILLTILIKAVFYYPTAMSYRSMGKMRIMAPKMQEIRSKYASDRAKQQQEMMKLYQKEKINPLGGCLPMLIQIPVFISLYWMLNETVELRQAPWILWYKDLSVKDPLFILPVLNGALMWFQQKLNPPPTDPMQARIFQWMPVVFTGLFLFFPAGLVLYWVVNSIISIAQQWYINQQLEKKGLGHKAAAAAAAQAKADTDK